MKVGFDGTVLHGRKSGVGYYCEELLKAMVQSDHETEFFVFSHQPLTLDLPSANGNVRFSDSRFCRVRALYLHALLPGILGREKLDLCHYTNFLAPMVDSTPYVVTIHDMGLERLKSAHPLPKRLYTRRLVPLIAERAQLIITNSEYSKWEIVRFLGIPADRIRVTPLAAAPEFIPLSREQRAPVLRAHGLTAPYWIYVGNLEPRKNLVRLLEAFAGLPEREHILAIVGNRWYRGDDAAIAARALGVSDRVRFLGYVPRSDLSALYGGATALVYPSLLEGFGLPVVEAMACGTPVITSDNSSLREIGGDAAVLVNASDHRSIRQAMADVLGDSELQTTLSARGLARAGEFSWQTTAALTLDVYREVADKTHRVPVQLKPPPEVAASIQSAIDYCALFQYPLRQEELRERLSGLQIDAHSFEQLTESLGFPRLGEFVTSSPDFVSTRIFREAISDRAIAELWPHLETLASMPFIRMIAFSGATAHRNMATAEDLDLFLVVEDGKLWATFLIAMIWAKAKGFRRRLCMNYVVSDRALPLFDHDSFTAQQAAALKPIFGRKVYDLFIASNPFIRDHFPNFNLARHRSMYPEIKASGAKALLERLLLAGPVQVLERISRVLLGGYLKRKAERVKADMNSDVLLEPRRLKLHMNSHRAEVLSHPVAGSLTPSEQEGRQEDTQVHR